MGTVCTGGEDPGVRAESDEFENLLREADLVDADDDISFECRTGFEEDCSPEQKLAARLNQVGPAAINWVFTLGGGLYGSGRELITSLKQNLTAHNAAKAAFTAAVSLPLVIAAPEGAVGAGIVVTARGVTHVAGRHIAGASASNASKFLARYTDDAASWTGLLTVAANTTPTLVTVSDKLGRSVTRYYRIVEMQGIVGFDATNPVNGLPTATRFFSVITELNGTLVTMFPGFPSMGFRALIP